MAILTEFVHIQAEFGRTFLKVKELDRRTKKNVMTNHSRSLSQYWLIMCRLGSKT